MSDSWQTPPWLYKALDTEFRFTLDPCPFNPDFDPDIDTDGLTLDWTGQRVFCNPPYSNIRPWIHKALSSACLCVLVLPISREDTGYMQALFDQKAELRWMAKRIEFDDEGGRPKRLRHGTVIAIVRNLHLQGLALL